MARPTRSTNRRTRVALASPLEPAGIAVIQLAGPAAVELLSRFFQPVKGPAPLVAGKLVLGWFSQAGQRIDQVMVHIHALPDKTDQLIDITSHGSVRVVQRIISALQTAGAEPADAADLAQNLQIYQLENNIARQAYRLMPKAVTQLAVKFALYQCDKGLAQLVSQAADALAEPKGDLTALGEQLLGAAGAWPAVRYLYEPPTVVLAGPPNTGKSTLANTLAGRSAALVSELAGTTRDWVQLDLILAGVPVRLIDTAGLGTTADPLGDQAQNRTRQQLQKADMIILVLDGSKPPSDLAQQDQQCLRYIKDVADQLSAKPCITVLNKLDLVQEKATLAGLPGVKISALLGQHIDLLGRQILQQLGLANFQPYRPGAFSEQQYLALTAAAEAIKTQQYHAARQLLKALL